LHYLVAGVMSFFAGLLTNYALSKLIVFKKEKSRVGRVNEFFGYAAIGGVGLLMTLGLMALLTECMHLYFMWSKVIATAIVLVWNFTARKYLLYK